MRAGRLVFLLLLLLAEGAWARPAEERLAVLARGVNITGWFRYPASVEAGRLAAYMPDGAMVALRGRGFTFVRLAVQARFLAPDGQMVSERRAAVLAAIARLRRAGLGVVVALFGEGWRLEDSAADRAALARVWRELAPALRPLGAGAVFPEILNEPVFAGDPAGWAELQGGALRALRAGWPEATVILTGANWGGVEGLLALAPVADPNVVYSAHVYEPAVLTSLAAFQPGLDRAGLARLPFPVLDPGACRAIAGAAADAATRAVGVFYCAEGWSPARVAARLGRLASWSRAHGGVAVLIGEFGSTRDLNAASRLAWLASVRRGAEGHGFGWALWGLDDVMGFGVGRPVPGRPSLDAAILNALGLAQ